jgi:hypothetical protein
MTVIVSSTTTDIPNIEHMSMAGTDDSGNIFSTFLKREDLDVAEQTIYDDAVALFNNKWHTTIDNTLSELTIDRMTSAVIDQDSEEVVDYTTMVEADKDKLRAFLTMALVNKDF